MTHFSAVPFKFFNSIFSAASLSSFSGGKDARLGKIEMKFVTAVSRIALVLAALMCGIQIAAAKKADPRDRYIEALENSIIEYKKIAAEGGWKTIPDGEKLKLGSSDPRVVLLRERLSITGDFKGKRSISLRMGKSLSEAVIRYQKRNGEEPDGVVGAATLLSLNIPVEQRIKQMKINLDRWKKFSVPLGNTYVLVNMAGFELDVIDNNNPVLNMRVIIGKDFNETPIFSDKISSIEVNPYWNVPESIANKELVEKFSKDVADADEKGYEIVQNGKAAAVTSVNWSSYANKTVPFSIRQRPGPKNVLGSYKFLFPNKYSIYLHDTNAKSLFEKTVRAFSHGCIRLEKPAELAQYILARDAGWNADKLADLVASGENTNIALKKPIPVHMAYMTAWVDDTGIVHFRPDIYGRDR
jgi:murein L,D-transpeptidase YcbB/YkuD